MANLVVCCDGTWNTPDQKEDGLPAPTNVARLFNALAVHEVAGVEQKKYYHPGVGTDGGWWNRLVGGGAGQGLSDNIKSAYQWLAYNYQPGDKIFLFGFSRGAYTVRSLSGMIGCCGLLAIESLEPDDAWTRINEAFDCYRSKCLSETLKSCKIHNCQPQQDPTKTTEIFFIGVWDTVGALGIPDDMALLNLIDDPRKHEFHDTTLSNVVKHARHAVAIDERRETFMPTLWTGIAAHQNAKQIWFPGVHGDVGGGYAVTDLSDAALAWMIGEANALDLDFRDISKQLNADAWGVAHDSLTGVFKALKTRPRNVSTLAGSANVFHQSAIDRFKTPPIAQGEYWPTKALAVDEQVTIDVFARQHWNATGLYLEEGASYAFTASGQWVDGKIKSAPDGQPDDAYFGEIVRMASSGLGYIESLYQSVTGNKQADFWWTKRIERFPWFSLVGVIANGVETKEKSPDDKSTFLIANGCARTIGPGEAGYLYCFANDAWHAYSNNKGSVALTVRRIK